MSNKQKYLILFCIIILTTILFFYFTSNMINSKMKYIDRLDNAIKVDQEKLNAAKVLNEQLQQVSKVIVNSISKERYFSSDETNAFVIKLADLADRYRITVNSLTPKMVSGISKYYAEQLYTLELNCTFIQLGQFLTDLESFDHILKIKTLDVRPLSQDSKNVNLEEETRYKVSLELLNYKIVKEA